jgi:hypothetical protein
MSPTSNTDKMSVEKMYTWVVNLILAVTISIISYLGGSLLNGIKDEMKEMNRNLNSISNKISSQEEINRSTERRLLIIEQEIKEQRAKKK